MDNLQTAFEIIREINNELPILLNKIRTSTNQTEREALREQYLYLIGILHLVQSDLNNPQMNNFFRREN